MSFSSSFYYVALLLAAVISPVTAQTWSSCNPTNASVSSCPDDTALGMNYTFDFSQSNVSTVWNTTEGTILHTSNGGEFTVNKEGDSPTMQSQFYIFFGSVEVHMRAAAGQGIISSIVLESDDLDEVDWEMMGGNNTHVETNYFGKGNTTSYDRAIYYPVDRPLDTFHNYTVLWTSDKIEWYIDTQLVRTLPYAAANGGNNFPQTPMNIRLGIWAGGDPKNSNGTIEWAGGLTDFTKGPYTMYVQNVTVKDQTTGSSSYRYTDKSGSWKSIKAISGNSTTQQALYPTAAAPSGWSTLSNGVKIGIYAAAGAVGAALIGLISFCCVKQRRAGRREQAAYLAKVESERLEAESFQMENKDPDALPTSTPTPSEFSRQNSTIGYTKSGAAGFGSSDAGYYTPPAVPPMPTLPPAYGIGGLKSPSAGGFDSPSHGGFPPNSGLNNLTNSGFPRNGSYNNASTGGYQSAGGYNNASTGGYQSATGYQSNMGFNNARSYSGNDTNFPSSGNNGYFQQSYSNNGSMSPHDRF